MVLLQRKLYFSKNPEGVQHFKGGSNFFQGGPNAYFYRNPYNLIFQGGPDPLTPPLDLHMQGSQVRISK